MSAEAPELVTTEGVNSTEEEPVSPHLNALVVLTGIAKAQKKIVGEVEEGLTAAIEWLKSQLTDSVSASTVTKSKTLHDTAQETPVNPLSSVLDELEAIPAPPPGRRTNADIQRLAAQQYLARLLAENIILPKYIYLKSPRTNQFASQWGNTGLKWEKTSPDQHCVYETIKRSGTSLYHIKGNVTGLRMNAYSWTLSKGITLASTDDSHSLTFSLTRLPDAGTGVDNFYAYTSYSGHSAYMQDTNASVKDAIESSTSANSNSVLTFAPYVTSSSIESIVYQTSNPSLSPEPPFVDEFILDNCLNDQQAAIGHDFAYTESEVGSWINTAGFSVSHEATFSAGIPLVAEGSVTIGTSFNASFSRGGETGRSKTSTYRADTDVPPYRSTKAVLTVQKFDLDLKFTYKERLNYSNNTVGYRDGTGTYKNVSSKRGVISFIPWTCPV